MQNDMRDRLVELIKQAKQSTKNANCDLERNMLFADHLIANGVIVKPCKIGQKVYVLYPDPRYNWGNDEITMFESKVYGFHYCDVYDGVIELRDSKHHIKWDIDSIGISIFLTKEQAEQKLKELSENG